MDHLSSKQRSRLMSRVKGRDTAPELFVRQLIHRLGYRYRLHAAKLPGKPDLVFPSRRKIIFVHGCFWHQHQCKRGSRPKSNRKFWNTKLASNRARDGDALRNLRNMGWRVMVVWECQLRDEVTLGNRVIRFLG